MRISKSVVAKATIFSMLATTGVYATNGDSLMGVGAKTRSMGGAGIALSHGAESTLVNPASITQVDGTEVSFGGTVFAPTIETDIGPSGTYTASAADLSIIPEVAIVSKMMPNVYLGVGMYGTAGMGTDFRGNPALMDMETTLQLMQFAVPVAYKMGGLSIGIAPILQYGSLDIHYVHPNPLVGTIGVGQTQDFGFGASAGATYDFNNGFIVGVVYKSKIEMSYDNVLSTSTAPFGLGLSDSLDQPAEIGVGFSYNYGAHTIAADYKKIMWSDAAGYSGFGWKDQDVVALGYEYAQMNWSLRMGYNYGSSVIELNAGTGADVTGAVLNMFNLLGFPATAKHHITAGGSYQFSDSFSTDLTIVYSPEETTTASISALGMGAAQISNTHSELGATIQFNYKF